MVFGKHTWRSSKVVCCVSIYVSIYGVVVVVLCVCGWTPLCVCSVHLLLCSTTVLTLIRSWYYVLLLYWLWYVGGIDWGVKLLTFPKCDSSSFFQFTFLLIENVKPALKLGHMEMCFVFKLCRNTPIGNCAPKGSQYMRWILFQEVTTENFTPPN